MFYLFIYPSTTHFGIFTPVYRVLDMTEISIIDCQTVELKLLTLPLCFSLRGTKKTIGLSTSEFQPKFSWNSTEFQLQTVEKFTCKWGEFQLSFNSLSTVEFQLSFNYIMQVDQLLVNFNSLSTVEFQLSFNYVCKWISYWWISTRFQLLNFSWDSTMYRQVDQLLVNFNSLSTVEFQLSFNVCKWISYWWISTRFQLCVQVDQLKNSHANELSFNWWISTRIQLAFNCWTSVEFQLYKQVDQLKNSHANELSFNWWISTRIQLAFNCWTSVEFQLSMQVDQLKNSHANEFSFNWCWINTVLNLSWGSTRVHEQLYIYISYIILHIKWDIQRITQIICSNTF